MRISIQAWIEGGGNAALQGEGLLTGVRTMAFRLGLDAQIRAALGM